MSPFLVVRFTHGSGGKFLASVIQTSNTVDHWSTVLQSHKHHEIFPALTKKYFERSFAVDHSLSLRSEPHSPYCADFYSGSRDRGSDITWEKYLEIIQQRQDARFFDAVNNGRLINLVFNKPNIPLFCQNSRVVTITIESAHEQKWVTDTLWQKHWIESPQELIYAPDDPDYCHVSRLAEVLKFNNVSRFSTALKHELKERYVYQNSTRACYIDSTQFAEHDQHLNIQNVFVSLESFFDKHMFKSAIKRIYDVHQLEPKDFDLIEDLRQIWVSRQRVFPCC